MQDIEDMDAWPAFAWLRDVLRQAVSWLVAHWEVPTLPSLAPQLALVLLTLVAAWLLARYFKPRTRRLFAAHERRPLLRRLKPLLFPLLWITLLWFAVAALDEAQISAKLVKITLALLVAWVGIRIAASFVASVFWSRAIAVVLVTTLALKATGLWTSTLSVLGEMGVTLGSVRLSVLGIAEASLILALSFWVAGLAGRRVDRWAEHSQRLSPSARVLLSKIFRFGATTLAVVVALHAVGIDLTTLAVFSGALGLGIGFGLQKIASNLFCGVLLLVDRSVKPGDVIAVDNHYGWIDSLGARYVSVLTRDGIEHLIPNEDLISGRVENWSHSSNLLRLHAPVGISYGADVDVAIALAEEQAKAVSRVLREPPPRCLMLGFGDSSIELELRFWIDDPRNGVHNVRSEVFRRIWRAYRAAGIEIPFPQRDLNLRSVVPVRVVHGEGEPGAEPGPGTGPGTGAGPGAPA